MIERLEKWNGEAHVLLTPGEYTQLTGRAGRRGIDTRRARGRALPARPRLPDRRRAGRDALLPAAVVVRPVLQHGRQPAALGTTSTQAETLLGALLRPVPGRPRDRGLGTTRSWRSRRALEGYDHAPALRAGDWADYWRLRHELRRLEKREAQGSAPPRSRDSIEEGIAELQPGDVLHCRGSGVAGWPPWWASQAPRGAPRSPRSSTDDRALTKLGPRELDGRPAVVDRVRLPSRGNPRQRDYRKAIAGPAAGRRRLPDRTPTTARPASRAGPSRVVEGLREQRVRTRATTCQDRADHERWQQRADKVTTEARQLRPRIGGAPGRPGAAARPDPRRPADARTTSTTHPRRPTRGCPWPGSTRGRICWSPRCVRRALRRPRRGRSWPAAGALFVYESRGGDRPPSTRDPDAGACDEAVDDVLDLAEELRALEEESAALPRRATSTPDSSPRPGAGRGARLLDDAVGTMDLTGGDFVRNIKQMADLAGQLRDVGRSDAARGRRDGGRRAATGDRARPGRPRRRPGLRRHVSDEAAHADSRLDGRWRRRCCSKPGPIVDARRDGPRRTDTYAARLVVAPAACDGAPARTCRSPTPWSRRPTATKSPAVVGWAADAPGRHRALRGGHRRLWRRRAGCRGGHRGPQALQPIGPLRRGIRD